MSDIIEVIKDVTTVTLASDGPQGPAGPTGNTGPTGPAGPPGADGVSGVISVVAPITNTGTSTAAILGINAGVANGVATLDSGGKIPQSQIPAVAITNTFVVASQAAMLALTAEEGDVAVRTDQNKTYILTATPASTLANWQELLTPTDTVLSVDGLTGSVDLTGKYSQLTATNTFLAQNIFNASSTSVVDLIVRASAGQTANLQEWQNSAGTVLFSILSNGRVSTNQRTNFGFPIASAVFDAQNNFSNDTDAARVVVLVRGAASQTADLQRWQDSAGTTLSFITSAGNAQLPIMGVGATALNTLGGTFRVMNSGAAAVGITVRGAASQTGNLQEWQNSAGTILARIDNGGFIRGQYTRLGTNHDQSNNIASIRTIATTDVGIIVQGTSGQTAALQQWQTSAGTVVAQTTSTGAIQAVNLTTLNNWFFAKEESGGGQLRLKKMTAAAANNRAADFAQLYLRDGTNTGTLKLVVIAGTTGTETTILDNISQ